MSEFLSVHRENADDLLAESLPLLFNKTIDYQGLLGICENYRIKGIVHLLLDAEPERLHRELYHSGRAFLHGLSTVNPATVVISQAVPLFDALACNDWEGGGRIARALNWTWSPDFEYEDDYLYVELLCRRFLLGLDDAATAARWARYDEVAPSDDFRGQVLRALEARDAEQFGAGLEELLTAHQKRYQLLVDAGRLADEQAETLPYFCAEGLALLRLAERAGIAVLDEYPLIPSLARGDFSAGFTEGSWPERRSP